MPQFEQPTLAVAQLLQPTLAVAQALQPTLAVAQALQPTLAVAQVLQPTLAVAQVLQPVLTVAHPLLQQFEARRKTTRRGRGVQQLLQVPQLDIPTDIIGAALHPQSLEAAIGAAFMITES